jgi:hypothetical protein
MGEDFLLVVTLLMHQHYVDAQLLGTVNGRGTTTDYCDTLIHA